MDFPFFRRLLLTLCLAVVPRLLATDEAASAKETAKPAEAAKPAEKVLELPKFEVLGAGRIREIDTEIRKLEKLITREKKKVKPGEVDKAFNNPKLSKAAAIFGGNSSDYLSSVAASRVTLLETERDVLEALKRPATLQARAEMQKELEQLRTFRRNLDDAAKQR